VGAIILKNLVILHPKLVLLSMADNGKKRILICWNNVQYINELTSHMGRKVEICYDFASLEKVEWNSINHIIVLIELLWSKENNNGSYSDLNGIKLVQHYIRSEKRIKLPILFVSFLKRSEILSIEGHADKKIISTPALEHEFIDVLEPINKWLEKIDAMKPMSDLDLKYTIFNFCEPDGLIRQILHIIYSCSNVAALKEQLRTLACLNNLMDKRQIDEYQQIKNDIESLKENDINEIKKIQNAFNDLCHQLSKTLKRD
jgi:hypothetical protein